VYRFYVGPHTLHDAGQEQWVGIASRRTSSPYQQLNRSIVGSVPIALKAFGGRQTAVSVWPDSWTALEP
jgi:hypothetical protein